MENRISASTNPNRWIPVTACVFVQFCLGTAYIWGVVEPGFISSWTAKYAALNFTLLLGVMALGSAMGGLLQDKFGPKPVIVLGGIIVAGDYALTLMNTAKTAWAIWITFGLILGFGMSLTYITSISLCQKWFPDKRGLMSGIIVSASGFGGLAFIPLIKILIDRYKEFKTFSWVALIFFAVSICCSFFINNPPHGYKPEGWLPNGKKSVFSQPLNYNPIQVLKTPQFYMISISIASAGAACMMVIPYTRVLGMTGGLIKIDSASGIMVITLSFALGCLFWGWLSDKFTRKKTLFTIMITAGISILLASSARHYLIILLLSISILGFTYGGFLSVFPSLTSVYWGTKYLGANYGMVLLGFGAGTVASSFITNYLKDLSGNNIIPSITASALVFFSALLIYFLKKPKLRTNQVIMQDYNQSV